jgi:hypothetical protein
MKRKLLTVLFLYSTISAFSQSNEAQYFHRSNGNIIDPSGNRFIIQATNVSCWLYHAEQQRSNTAHNTGFASGGVTWKLEALCFYSSSVQVDSFVLRNPPERKARNR